MSHSSFEGLSLRDFAGPMGRPCPEPQDSKKFRKGLFLKRETWSKYTVREREGEENDYR
jgi:hypothetical protein